MFKKMLPWLIMILIAITLITLAAFVLWEYIMKDASTDPNALANDAESRQLTATEIGQQTVKIEEIATNLSDEYVVRASFAFLLTSEAAKEEMELVEHLVKARIIRTLADTSSDEIKGSEGIDDLSAKLINLINPILQQGSVRQVDVTDMIITLQR